MSTIADSAVVTLGCAEPDCTQAMTCQARHVENLTAGGWRCSDHKQVTDR